MKSILLVIAFIALFEVQSFAVDPSPPGFSIIFSDPSTGTNSLRTFKEGVWITVSLPSVKPNTWRIVGAPKGKIVWCNTRTKELAYWVYDDTGKVLNFGRIGFIPTGANITCTGE